MVSPKQLTLLAAAGVAASLFLAQPARALTAIAQPYLNSSSWERVDAVQPIKQRRCYGYRDGRRVYRPCASPSYKKRQRMSGYSTSRQSGPYKPWSGIQLCENCPAK